MEVLLTACVEDMIFSNYAKTSRLVLKNEEITLRRITFQALWEESHRSQES